jgi:hypothetical protein
MSIVRLIPVLSLTLVLWAGAMAMAYVQGPQRTADGTFVICSGSGTITVSIGQDGDEKNVTLPCPDCLPLVWANADNLLDGLPKPQWHSAKHQVFANVAERFQDAHWPHSARAPPYLV